MTTSVTNDYGTGLFSADGFVGPQTNTNTNAPTYGPALFPSGSVGAGLTAQAAAALTAHVGGGQANALQLSAYTNEVTTVATAADSVKLPPSQAGMVVWVANAAAANSMQVFGTAPDTINGVATATGVAQASATRAAYFCPVAGKWYRVLSA